MRNNEKEIPRHLPPKGSKTQNQELLYDPNVLTPSHAEQAQTLVSKMATATLCTMSIEPAGYPTVLLLLTLFMKETQFF